MNLEIPSIREAEKFGKKIFEVIHNVKNTFILDKDYNGKHRTNPGETAAVKLMKKDKFFFDGAVVDDLPLYGNQFIPLGIKTTLQKESVSRDVPMVLV
jgi:hypothetical protein